MIAAAKPQRIIWPDAHPVGEWLGPLFVLLVFGLLVVGAVLVTRTIVNSRGATPSAPAASGPLRILEERFARGEIDEEEFKRRRDILRG